MKETFYFSHDYNARTDEKIKKLIKKHGMTGYGIYWSIVEDLYNNENSMRTDYDSIAYDLRSENEVIKSIINDFGLFSIEDDFFGSESIERRLDERSERSEKARQKAFKRWRMDVNDDAKVLTSDAAALKNDTTVTKTDAGKERKVKDIKGDDIKGYKIKNSRKSGKILSAFVNQEEEKKRKEEEFNRTCAHVRETESEIEDYNTQDLMGGELELESEPDRKVIFGFTKPKEPPIAEELEPKKSAVPITKSAEPKTKVADPKAEKVGAPDWDDEVGPHKKSPVISAPPEVKVNVEPSSEREPKESVTVNAEPDLKQKSEELIVEKFKSVERVDDSDDW